MVFLITIDSTTESYWNTIEWYWIIVFSGMPLALFVRDQQGFTPGQGRHADWFSGRIWNSKWNNATFYQIMLYYKNYSKLNLY